MFYQVIRDGFWEGFKHPHNKTVIKHLMPFLPDQVKPKNDNTTNGNLTSILQK